MIAENQRKWSALCQRFDAYVTEIVDADRKTKPRKKWKYWTGVSIQLRRWFYRMADTKDVRDVTTDHMQFGLNVLDAQMKSGGIKAVVKIIEQRRV